MSAFGYKRTFSPTLNYVRFTPESGHCLSRAIFLRPSRPSAPPAPIAGSAAWTVAFAHDLKSPRLSRLSFLTERVIIHFLCKGIGECRMDV